MRLLEILLQRYSFCESRPRMLKIALPHFGYTEIITNFRRIGFEHRRPAEQFSGLGKFILISVNQPEHLQRFEIVRSLFKNPGAKALCFGDIPAFEC
ncbi:MAG: hypothetical protein BWY69_01560 [Planctomycetes bacterium ADurb.Bin401]|nr:MAG: hypothetical protein BWY69_01560 [Planctomycetes bacterium ADurb.Bin401]